MVTMSQRFKKLSFFDIKLMKWHGMFLALIIAKLIPEIMKVNIWWFVGLCILFSIKPFYVLWIKDN